LESPNGKKVIKKINKLWYYEFEGIEDLLT